MIGGDGSEKFPKAQGLSQSFPGNEGSACELGTGNFVCYRGNDSVVMGGTS